MSRLPPVPSDVVWFSPTTAVGPATMSFGFWMLWPGLGPGTASWAELVVSSWVINVQQLFLNLMHSAARFRTCRILVGGSPPFRFETEVADNAGAGTAGQDLGLAIGLYLQTVGGGRGSGSRLRVAGISNEMTTDFAYLSDFGHQELVFAADALAGWPAQLGALGFGTPVLGTLQRRDQGTPMPTAQFDPLDVIRPSLLLEVLGRRQKSIRGLSPL